MDSAIRPYLWLMNDDENNRMTSELMDFIASWLTNIETMKRPTVNIVVEKVYKLKAVWHCVPLVVGR